VKLSALIVVAVAAAAAAAEKYESFAARKAGSIAAYKPGMAKEASLPAQMTTMAD
jgi:hypothetical protein